VTFNGAATITGIPNNNPPSYFSDGPLDGFKNVNDSLGHDAGDVLLGVVAARLLECVRTSDTVARLGGDEFAVLIEESERPEGEATVVAARILQRFSDPTEVLGVHITARASIGIAIGDIGDNGADVLRDADIAMYHAKTAGRGQAIVFRPDMQAAVTERLQIEVELAGALNRDELRVVYQPVIELERDALTGFEALIRWRHPTLGDIVPDRFIPIAEESGMIIPIGSWVLRTACHAAVDWQRRYPRVTPITMAVNLSARELANPKLVANVAGAIQDSGIDPATLVLEITESVLVEDTDIVAARLHELHALGLRIAVDDFGTGYSSLSYLRQFPIDILKIDQSFVRMIEDQEHLPSIVRGLLDLGSTLKLETVAEGVELPFQSNQLRKANCDFAQGYLFARPLEPEDADRYLMDEGATVVPNPLAST
jgi:diguanylate cyclase (GGDEF)-like protein